MQAVLFGHRFHRLTQTHTIINMNTRENLKDWAVYESSVQYGENYPLKDETYEILGKCFEVHKTLGKGFLEVIYKDALEIEFQAANIPYQREKEYPVFYKDILLNRKFYADFVVFNDVMLEVKAVAGVIEEHYPKVLNYLAVSKCKVALLVNFGESSLKFKRIVLTK